MSFKTYAGLLVLMLVGLVAGTEYATNWIDIKPADSGGVAPAEGRMFWNTSSQQVNVYDANLQPVGLDGRLACDYLVYTNGTHYFAKNCSTGVVEKSGTDFAVVVNQTMVENSTIVLNTRRAYLNNPIFLKDGVRLVGMWPYTHIIANASVGANAMIRGEDVSNILLENLFLDANNVAERTLQIVALTKNISNIQIRNVKVGNTVNGYIWGCGNIGSTSSPPHVVSNVRLVQYEAINCPDTSYDTVTFGFINGLTVERSTFKGLGKNVLLYGVRNANLRGNTFENITARGLVISGENIFVLSNTFNSSPIRIKPFLAEGNSWAFNTTNVNIIGNVLVGDSAIALLHDANPNYSVSHVSIMGNILNLTQTVQAYGVATDVKEYMNLQRITIADNQIYSSRWDGLWLYYIRDLIISGNYVAEPNRGASAAPRGLYLNNIWDALVIGNTFYDRDRYMKYGIYLNNSANVTLNGNSVSGSVSYSIYVDPNCIGCSGIYIRGNAVEKYMYGGVQYSDNFIGGRWQDISGFSCTTEQRGTIAYNYTSNTLYYCNSTDWVAM